MCVCVFVRVCVRVCACACVISDETPGQDHVALPTSVGPRRRRERTTEMAALKAFAKVGLMTVLLQERVVILKRYHSRTNRL